MNHSLTDPNELMSSMESSGIAARVISTPLEFLEDADGNVPLADPQMNNRFKKYGRLGARLTRSTINSAALFAMLESGMFEELPNLRVVVTALALGGVLLAGTFSDGTRLSKDAPAVTRRDVYIDTTGLHPVRLRTAIDLLGADHVLMGTDWPVVADTSKRMQAVLSASGLDASEQQMVASGNTLKLLGVG